MKKFIKGCYELDKNIDDLVTYEEPKKKQLLMFVNWCYENGVFVKAGLTEENEYVCNFKIIANSKAMCNALKQEFKEQLLEIFPYVKTIWEASGDQLF